MTQHSTTTQGTSAPPPPRTAVLIPCHNEAATIASVIADFAAALPATAIYVYDNNSTDDTREIARAAGAIVRAEPLQGKGNVVRRMFADVEADVYILVDGDRTYDAASAPAMVDRLESEDLDMVSGARVASEDSAYRPGHRFGNLLLTKVVAWIFGNRFRDLLSGYRVLSRRFVKSFPALSPGFEIETELTVHALELRMPFAEMDAPYGSRPEGSTSKLNTVRDGVRILTTILRLAKEERPLPFYGFFAFALALAAAFSAWPLLITYLETGLVPRLPTAVLVTGMMIIAVLSLTCGLILDTVTRGRREMKRMHYLREPRHNLTAPPAARAEPLRKIG